MSPRACKNKPQIRTFWQAWPACQMRFSGQRYGLMMPASKKCFAIGAVLLLLATIACDAAPQVTQTNAASTNLQYYAAKGVIKELKPDGITAVIAHEAVSNYMPAMTMPFEVRNTSELRGLRVGDAVDFRICVTDKEGWIDQVTKSGTVIVTDNSTRPLVHIVRDVPILKEGDLLPDYQFTNELGQVVNF